MSPVHNETDYDLDEQCEGNDDFGDVDEVSPEIAHGSAFHHLSNKAESNDKNPHSRSLVVHTLQAANALICLLFLVVFFNNLFAREGASLALFADDLEGRGDDSDQERDKPQTENDDAHNEEQRADQVVGV